MGLHEAQFEQRLDYDPTFRSTRSPRDQSPGRALTPIREYLQSLYTREIDEQTRSLRRCPIQQLFQLHPMHETQSLQKPLRSIVQVDEYGMVRKEAANEAERGDETDMEELKAIQEANWNQLKRLNGYRILSEEEDDDDVDNVDVDDVVDDGNGNGVRDVASKEGRPTRCASWSGVSSCRRVSREQTSDGVLGGIGAIERHAANHSMHRFLLFLSLFAPHV